MPYIPDVIPPPEWARFVKGTMGVRAGFGARPAVLVDMTRAFVKDRFLLGSSKAGEPCLHAVRRLLDVARPLGLPIIYTRYGPSPSTPSGDGGSTRARCRSELADANPRDPRDSGAHRAGAG